MSTTPIHNCKHENWFYGDFLESTPTAKHNLHYCLNCRQNLKLSKKAPSELKEFINTCGGYPSDDLVIILEEQRKKSKMQ